MPVAFRAAAVSHRGTGNPLVATRPPESVQNDLLVMVEMADKDGTLANITNPTGWVTAGETGAYTTVGDMRVWRKIQGAAEPATYAMGTNPNADTAVVIYSYQAGTFDPANPLANIQFNGSATSTSTHTAPSAAGVDGGMLTCSFAAGDSAGAARTWGSYTAGLTEVAEVGIADSWVGIGGAIQVLTSAAATNTKTATCSDSTPFIACSFVVNPLVTAGTTTTVPTITETSVSTDSVTIGRAVFPPIPTEVSTSTDAVTAALGRPVTETSVSTDGITEITKINYRYPVETSLSTDNVSIEFVRADISDYQFVIVEDSPNTMNPWVPFGEGQAISGKFAPGSFGIVDQDQSGTIGDFRMFGTDKHSPPTWAWSLFTDMTNPADALAWTDLLKQVWDHPIRETPEGVLALRYKVAGRMRRVYGRPRRFSDVPDAIQRGKIHIEADFALSEDVYYEDEERTATARLAPASAAPVPVAGVAGIVLPQKLPWRFSSQATNTGGGPGVPPQTAQAVVEGSKRTWVDIDIVGPVTNPWVRVGNLTWGLQGTLQATDKITLSGKPWSLGVRRPDGTNLPGWLDPRARLTALQMDPGVYSVQFGGLDSTGTSRAVLRWRNAHRSL